MVINILHNLDDNFQEREAVNNRFWKSVTRTVNRCDRYHVAKFTILWYGRPLPLFLGFIRSCAVVSDVAFPDGVRLLINFYLWFTNVFLCFSIHVLHNSCGLFRSIYQFYLYYFNLFSFTNCLHKSFRIALLLRILSEQRNKYKRVPWLADW